ncbi:DNA primase [Candidatus Bipolaricaulota bacterium]|nr:DNA primase [Candidatus Bipolaricaulota bacterium]
MPGQRADVKELKARLDMISIISRYVTLVKSGTGYKAKCPFHKDDTPSMTVSAEKGLWHCFGCGEGGDVIGFVMKIERLSFIEVVRRLAEEVGLSFEAADDGARDELKSLMADVANAFARNLRSDAGEKARDYLISRGYPESCWLKYGLGYAMPGWDHIKRTFSRRGEDVLLKLGLLVQGDKGTYDRFRDRTIFPILDLSGRPVGFGGRTFDGDPKYLNSPQTPLFDKGRLMYGISWARDRMSETRAAVLVEGYTDVLSLHQAGITHAVGSMGTSLTQGQADLLKRFVEDVVICYDQDAAGSAASLRGMQILYNSGLGVRVAQLPAGEDPDGYVRTHGAEAMQAILDEALPFHRFFIESLKARHDVTTIRGKEHLLEDAREFYGSVRSAALREEIDRQIADLIGLSVESVRRELPRRPRARDPEEPIHEPAMHWGVEEHLLALVLRGQISWEKIAFEVSADDFSEANRPIARRLASGMTDLSELIGDLDEEGARRASYYALAPLEIDVDQTIEDAKRWMGQLPAIEKRLKELDPMIKRSATAEDWELWDRLAREKAELRIAWRRAKDATGEGIHEQQSQEGRSEIEAS